MSDWGGCASGWWKIQRKRVVERTGGGTRRKRERAVQLLAAITKVQVGKETARRQTEQAGKRYEEVQDAEASRLMDAREEVAPWQYEPAARQVFSSDGAMVPLVHGVWAEVKMVVL